MLDLAWITTDLLPLPLSIVYIYWRYLLRFNSILKLKTSASHIILFSTMMISVLSLAIFTVVTSTMSIGTGISFLLLPSLFLFAGTLKSSQAPTRDSVKRFLILFYWIAFCSSLAIKVIGYGGLFAKTSVLIWFMLPLAITIHILSKDSILSFNTSNIRSFLSSAPFVSITFLSACYLDQLRTPLLMYIGTMAVMLIKASHRISRRLLINVAILSLASLSVLLLSADRLSYIFLSSPEALRTLIIRQSGNLQFIERYGFPLIGHGLNIDLDISAIEGGDFISTITMNSLHNTPLALIAQWGVLLFLFWQLVVLKIYLFPMAYPYGLGLGLLGLTTIVSMMMIPFGSPALVFFVLSTYTAKLVRETYEDS